ncbi:hypothetical protein E2F47_24725 [Mycobacterium eburneum]|nr:hypothetical protein E2F47_24725 [Mycobacterium eburneum]
MTAQDSQPSATGKAFVTRREAKRVMRQLYVGIGALLLAAVDEWDSYVESHNAPMRTALTPLARGYHIASTLAASIDVWLSTPGKHPRRHVARKPYAWPEVNCRGRLNLIVHHEEMEPTNDRRSAYRLPSSRKNRCGAVVPVTSVPVVSAATAVKFITTNIIDPRTPKQEAGPPTPADGTALTSTPRVPVKPARMTREPTFTPHPRPEPTTPEKGGVEHSPGIRHALITRDLARLAHANHLKPNQLRASTGWRLPAANHRRCCVPVCGDFPPATAISTARHTSPAQCVDSAWPDAESINPSAAGFPCTSRSATATNGGSDRCRAPSTTRKTSATSPTYSPRAAGTAPWFAGTAPSTASPHCANLATS